MAETPRAGTEFYYNTDGARVPLNRAPDMFTVRFKPGVRSDDPSLPVRVQRFLRDESEHVEFLPDSALQIYRMRARDERTLTEMLSTLTQSPGVEFASPVYRSSPNPLDVTLIVNRIVVEFKPEVDARRAEAYVREFCERYGASVVERLGYTKPASGYLIQVPNGDGPLGPVALAQRFFEEAPLRYALPDLVQRRAMRGTVLKARAKNTGRERAAAAPASRSDWTYRAEQWHLQAAHVEEAWAEVNRGDPAIVIAVADDGIDVAHPEFQGKIAGQFDFAGGVPDGTPKQVMNNHGTACAGTAVARGVNAAGAAPNCRLLAVRFPDYLGVADEARMFQWMADNGADVISCSWGPPDGTGAPYPLPGNVQRAIHYCVTTGRGGRGIPIFWAGGNGNESVTLDGYAANPDVIAVAACTEHEQRSYYSDFGPMIAVCAPSSGTQSAGDRRVFTTDRRGASGYNVGGGPTGGDAGGDYTNDFGGTSAAAPLVAGIAGLMLSANPNLTWQQVKQILMDTADKIGSGYDQHGHSDQFGHGRVNALQAVKAARSAPTSTPAPVVLRIEGPATASRGGPSPRFRISLPGARYYAVEVATEARLFNSRQNAAQRTPDNFYASWQDGGLLTQAEYELPPSAWARLDHADRLFYRMSSSTSPDQWVDYSTTTTGDMADSAPSVQILAGSPSETASIVGPASATREAAPPRFQIQLPPGRFHAVEVATSAGLLNPHDAAFVRTPDNFYATWQDSSLRSGSEYTLGDDAWIRLRSADRLFYRMWVSASATQWLNAFATTPNDRVQTAPSVQLTGTGAAPRTDPAKGRYIEIRAEARLVGSGNGEPGGASSSPVGSARFVISIPPDA